MRLAAQSSGGKTSSTRAHFNDWFMNIDSPVLRHLSGAMRRFDVSGLEAGFCVVEDNGALPDSALLALLPLAELERLNAFQDVEERRHFLFRRGFQQLFVAHHIGWQGPVNQVSLVHGQDKRPRCTDFPGLKLSFTSTGKTYLFGAAENADLGVDIERLRFVRNAAELARRFFLADEADAVASRVGLEQSRHFLTLWSAKEAGLKALGKGVVDGLNTFTFANVRDQWVARHGDGPESAQTWRLCLPDWLPGCIVAILHRFPTP